MRSDPAVSVIIPTYNGERYIEEAILSVLGQTYKDHELIVVDDGSVTDATKKICERYSGKLTYVRQENKGLAAARNTGIRNSKGRYVAFLDDDDVWLPEKLGKQIGFYEDLKKKGICAGLIYTGVQEWGKNGEFLYNHLWKSDGYNYKTMLFIDFIGYGGSSVMISRQVLDDVGYFDESLQRSEDYDMWLRIAKKYPIYSLDEFLTKYRNKDISLSKDPAAMILGTDRVLRKILKTEDDMDEKMKERLIKHFKRFSALRWKIAAYECLFENADGKMFRDYVRKGFLLDRSHFGFKVLVYYLLSFVAPSLCPRIRRLKDEKCEDIILNVKDLKLDEHYG